MFIDYLSFGKQQTAPFKAPNASVSPFIRGSRYMMLGAGILYGSWRLKYLTRKEDGIQKKEDAIRAKRDVRLAKESEAATKLEMNTLAQEVGVDNRV